MEFNYVLGNGIDRLYHWERFNPEWLKKTLTDRTIYCSDPATFNDPWDGKPHFNIELLQHPIEREKYARFAIDQWQRFDTGVSEESTKKMEALLCDSEPPLQVVVERASKDMATGCSEVFRAYCMGPDVGNLLMWSHYADGHKGICIEFNTNNKVIGTAYRVEYRNEYPVWKLYDPDRMRYLLTKADVWKYEKEYRLIAQQRENTTSKECLATENNYLKLPENAVLSIIVGCNGPYEEVCSLVDEVAPHIPVKKARHVPNKFEVKID